VKKLNISYFSFATPSFIFLFLCYCFAGIFGYGNDNDSYALLKSGQNLIINQFYSPSRTQGSLITEIIIGITSIIGKHFLTNLISAILGVSSLLLFYNLIKRIFEDHAAILITFIVGLNPFIIIASSSTMDYIYSMFFILAGIHLLIKNKLLLAAVFMAFALSSRLSNCLVVGVVYLYFLLDHYKTNKVYFLKLLRSGVFALVLTLTLYIPVFIVSGNNLSFLEYGIGDWSTSEIAARFIYKNFSLFSLLGSISIFTILIFGIFRKTIKLKFGLLISMILLMILLIELMFLKVPVEISYLLPILFVVIPVFYSMTKSKLSLYVLLFLTVVYNFLNVDILKIEYNEDRTEAINAETGLFIKPGIIIEDISRRKQSQEYYFLENAIALNHKLLFLDGFARYIQPNDYPQNL